MSWEIFVGSNTWRQKLGNMLGIWEVYGEKIWKIMEHLWVIWGNTWDIYIYMVNGNTWENMWDLMGSYP